MEKLKAQDDARKAKNFFNCKSSSSRSFESSAPPAKKVKTDDQKKQTQSSMRDFIGNEPVLLLCGTMIVEDGRPISNDDSKSMQLLITWGKKGVGDTSKTAVNSVNVRGTIQKEANLLRESLKKDLKGKVVNLCVDMATKDGRCFIGKISYIFMLSF